MSTFLHDAFNNPHTRRFHIVNDTLALVTIISIVALVLETVPTLASYHALFLVVEWVAVAIFTAEYVARLAISRPLWRYPTSFFGLVDLIAILPTFVGLGNFTFLKSARALRIIRLLRMARLAKMGRTAAAAEEEFGVFTFNILIYLVTLLTALLFAGTLMYVVEPTHEAFTSIPAGMWWSFKVFLGGITVATPDTALGETFYVLTRFIGLLLLGLLVGVVGNIFRQLVVGHRS
jgi:voltage-gated potassium channel